MSYKDLSKEELAALSDYGVEQLIKTEMMEQSVKVVGEPEPFTLLKPRLKTEKFYSVAGVLFKTMSQAEKFLALNPQKDDWSWNATSEFKYSEPMTSGINVVELHVKEEVLEKADELVAWASQKIEYDGMRTKYDSYCRTKGNIAKAVWEAVRSAREEIRKASEIRDAYYEYIQLANGDEEVAKKFLFKTYGEEKARAAIGVLDSLDLPAPMDEAEQIAGEANA